MFAHLYRLPVQVSNNWQCWQRKELSLASFHRK